MHFSLKEGKTGQYRYGLPNFMTRPCWNDYKWIVDWVIVILILEILLVSMTYTIGYMVGDTAATRQCIESQQQRKY